MSSSIPVCENPHGLCLTANPITLWANCYYEADFHKALSIYIYQKIFTSGSSPFEKKNLSWAFGPNFIKTVEAFGFRHQESKIKILLRACAETILGEATRDVHAIRKSEGGNAVQKKHGANEANRRDIDYEFHLHYWKTANGPIFISIVAHDDTSIAPAENVEFTSLNKCIPHLAQEQED